MSSVKLISVTKCQKKTPRISPRRQGLFCFSQKLFLSVFQLSCSVFFDTEIITKSISIVKRTIQTTSAVMMSFFIICRKILMLLAPLIRGSSSLYFGTSEIILPDIRNGNQCLLVLRGAPSSIPSIRRVGRPFFLIFSSRSYSWPTIYLIYFALTFLTARIRYSHSGSTGFLISMGR